MSVKVVFWSMFVFAVVAAGCTPTQPVTATPASATPVSPTPISPTPVPAAPVTSTFTLTDSPITQEETITVTKPSPNRQPPNPQPSNPQVMQAIQDLAGRVGVSVDAITVISAEPVVWPDGGLGCPQPGMEYLQVQQDGMKIVLAVDGREYQYHSGETRGPFLCENPADGG